MSIVNNMKTIYNTYNVSSCEDNKLSEIDKKKKYNLKDVANLAGVSLGTASKVINQVYVKPESRIKVENAIKELNYVPNAIARSLKVNNSKTIGVVIPNISRPINGKVLRGIEDAGNKAGYSILIYDTDTSESSEKKALALLKEKMVEGIIYVSNTMSKKTIQDIIQNGINTTLIMTSVNEKGFSSVTLDNEAAAYDMVSYLISCNHKRILMLAGDENDKNAGEPRLNGYRRALEEHGIPIDEDLIFCGGDYEIERGYRDMQKILKNKKLEFTAIFAASDELAMGAMRAIKESGRNVPEDYSIAGFDGIAISNYVFPSLCTIEQPFYQFGVEGMKILIDSLDKKRNDTHLKLDWNIRKTDSVRKI